MGIAHLFRRLYVQFIVIILIAVLFAYILNALFSIAENQTRIMFTALFLAGFAVILMAFEKLWG
jgi:predicted cobalt transporter CbtA